jgi:NAD(P)-dependent dehydrogenase (short-subunit alcohol dehydrogenase family)
MNATTVAFITGGNRGLGLETARGLGQLGIQIVIGVRDLAKGDSAVRQLQQEGIHAESVLFDALNAQTHQDTYNYLDRKYGKLDILVNNAGVALGPLFGNKQRLARFAQTDLRHQFLFRHRADANLVAADQEVAGRPHRQPGQHSGFTHCPSAAGLTDCFCQGAGLQRLQDRS